MKESRSSPEDRRRGGRLPDRDDRSDCAERAGDAADAVELDRAGEPPGVVGAAASPALRDGDGGGVDCRSSVPIMCPVPSRRPV